MSQAQAGLLGVAAGAAGVLAILLVSLLLEHPFSPGGVERYLQRETQRALINEGLGFAQVQMRGQTAILMGEAPDAASRERAAAVALTAVGRGGPWWGAVARVRNDLELADTAPPEGWRAVRSPEGKLQLSGAAPSLQVRDALRQRAQSLFPEGVDDNTVIAGPGGGAWEELAMASLHQLARLQTGEARLLNSHLILMGVGDQKALAAARAMQAEPLPGNYAIELDLVEHGTTGAEAFTPTPEACGIAARSALMEHPIRFATSGLADPGPVAHLARVLRRCDRHLLQVSVRATGLQEAEARGQALLDALLAHGVRAAHVQLEPLAQKRGAEPLAISVRSAKPEKVEEP